MSFLEKLERKYHAKFVTASPAKVDFFTHDLDADSEANNKAAADLTSGDHTLVKRLPAGDLILCKDGIIFLTEDDDFPIKFFCAWKHFLVAKKAAIQAKLVWCDSDYRKLRIDGKPLAAYCLFDMLLPKYSIVVSADEHTPDGERLEKNQIKHAVHQGVFVYVRDENNLIFKLEDPNVVVEDADVF